MLLLLEIQRLNYELRREIYDAFSTDTLTGYEINTVIPSKDFS